VAFAASLLGSAAQISAILQIRPRRPASAVAFSLIQTHRLNDVAPQAWLVHPLARIADHPFSRLDELRPRILQTAQVTLAA